MAEETNQADPFADGKDVKPNQVKFSKINDFIIGYYNGHKQVNGQNGVINMYELKGIMGSYHDSETTDDGNGNKLVKVAEEPTLVEEGEYYFIYGGKGQIDDLFKRAKIGQKVGFRFESTTPAKKAGNSPFKQFKATLWDVFDPGVDIEEAL